VRAADRLDLFGNTVNLAARLGSIAGGGQLALFADGLTHPAVGAALRKRQATVPAKVKEIAWKAQHRLYLRHRHLAAHGKCPQQVVTAVGRELLGFIWAIGMEVETTGRTARPAAA